MQLDIPTVTVMEIGAAALVGLILPSARDARSAAGFREFTAAAFCIAAAFTSFLVRGSLPLGVAIVAGNVPIWAALALHLIAYRRFDRGRAATWRPLGLVAVLAAAFVAAYLAGASYRLRTLASSVVIASFGAAAAHELARGGALARERSRVINLGLSLLLTLSFAVRVILLLGEPHPSEDFMAPSLERSIGFFPAMFYTLGSGLGFLVLHRERLAALAREQALVDPLTGCANRRALEDRVRSELAHARRVGAALALVVVDVDHFKAVNDRHGHAIGDEVLRHVAGVLVGGVRGSDVVARYGGEEFCVLLRDADGATAQLLAERLRVALAEAGVPIEGTGEPVRVTASFGVAAAAAAAIADAAWDDLFRRADAALYRAKQAGRNRTEAA